MTIKWSVVLLVLGIVLTIIQTLQGTNPIGYWIAGVICGEGAMSLTYAMWNRRPR